MHGLRVCASRAVRGLRLHSLISRCRTPRRTSIFRLNICLCRTSATRWMPSAAQARSFARAASWRVNKPAAYAGTAVIRLRVPMEYADEVRSMKRLKKEGNAGMKEEEVLICAVRK